MLKTAVLKQPVHFTPDAMAAVPRMVSHIREQSALRIRGASKVDSLPQEA